MADDPKPAEATHVDPDEHVLFDDLVKRQEARDAALADEGVPLVPSVPPSRPAPPPTLDPSNVTFGPPEADRIQDSVAFEAWTSGAVFDPLSYIPTGRLLPTSDPNAAELSWEDTLPDTTGDDRFVVLKQDVWEEVVSPGSDRPTHVLRFSKGQRVPKAALVGLKAIAVEQAPVRNVQTKGRKSA